MRSLRSTPGRRELLSAREMQSAALLRQRRGEGGSRHWGADWADSPMPLLGTCRVRPTGCHLTAQLGHVTGSNPGPNSPSGSRVIMSWSQAGLLSDALASTINCRCTTSACDARSSVPGARRQTCLDPLRGVLHAGLPCAAALPSGQSGDAAWMICLAGCLGIEAGSGT